MCIFRTKSELEKLQSQLNEVKLQAEKDEQLVKQLQEEIAEHKRIKSLLLRKIETLMKDEPLAEEDNTTNVEDKEFVTGDKEFAVKTRKMVCKTEDEEYIIPTTNNHCDAIEAEAKLLAKELIHLWAFREERRDAPLGGFSNIEWGGVSSIIVRALNAYIKEGKLTDEEQQDITWMFDMFEEFDGKL